MITSPDPGQRLVVNQTNPATFDCSATGGPTPLIQWYQGDLLLDGTGLGINSRVDLTSTVNDGSLGEIGTVMSTLAISNTVGSDSGTYTCLATNVLTNYTQMIEERAEERIDLFVQGMIS